MDIILQEIAAAYLSWQLSDAEVQGMLGPGTMPHLNDLLLWLSLYPTSETARQAGLVQHFINAGASVKCIEGENVLLWALQQDSDPAVVNALLQNQVGFDGAAPREVAKAVRETSRATFNVLKHYGAFLRMHGLDVDAAHGGARTFPRHSATF